jgi:hypothetical protein
MAPSAVVQDRYGKNSSILSSAGPLIWLARQSNDWQSLETPNDPLAITPRRR